MKNIESIKDKKNILRAQMKIITASLSDSYRQTASADIVRQCVESGAFTAADSIFVYISMPGEPDTKELIHTAFEQHKKVYVPRCLEKGIMEAVRIESFDCLKSGHYGIMEPDSSIPASEVSEFDAADTLAFIPCVAAARDGRRLGHGAGYYDRFLVGTNMKKYLLVYGRQIVDDIPCDELDIRMDRVVSEQN